MTKFKQYQEEMNPFYKDYNAFKNKTLDVCYIPENAEDLSDTFTYLDLRNEIISWLEDNNEYLTEHETNIESILTNMFESLSWEFPSTFLDQLNY